MTAGRAAPSARAADPATPVGGRSVRRAMLAAALVAVAAALVGLPARATQGARTTADEPQYLLTAQSLADDGDLDISDELAAQRWRAYHEAPLPQQTRELAGGVRISPHDPLLPVLLAPGVAVAGWVGARVTLALLGGVLAALLVWTAAVRLAVPPRTAALVTGLFAASVPFAPYGGQVYPELPAALAVAAGLAALLGPWRRAGPVAVVAGACVALPWLGIKYAPVAAVLAGVALVRCWRDGRRATVGVLAGGLVLAGVLYLAVHQAVWTGWTVYASADHFVDSGVVGVVGFAPDWWARATRLVGLLVERSFGIAAWQPAWLLAVPAVAAVVRARPRGWAALLPVLAVGWAMASFVALTMAGWWVPGRQLVVVLPAAVLCCAWWAARVRWAVPALAALGLVGVWSWLWLAVETTVGPVTLVFDLYESANPAYRTWRLALPDYLAPTATTWWLHGVWLVALAALATVGWRSAAPPATRPPRSGEPGASHRRGGSPQFVTGGAGEPGRHIDGPAPRTAPSTGRWRSW